MRPLSPLAEEALTLLIIEPLWKRRGFFVRPGEIAGDAMAMFPGALIGKLREHGLVQVRPRLNPRRIEVTLTRAGRDEAARILGARGDAFVLEAAE